MKKKSHKRSMRGEEKEEKKIKLLIEFTQLMKYFLSFFSLSPHKYRNLSAIPTVSEENRTERKNISRVPIN